MSDDVVERLKAERAAIEVAADAMRAAIDAHLRSPALDPKDIPYLMARHRDARKIVERALKVTWLDRSDLLGSFY